MKSLRIICHHILTIAFIFLPFSVSGYCGEPDTVSRSDGPYVFWQSDTTAVVFYYCDGELIKETLQVSNSFHFNGLCGDSTDEYIIKATPYLPEPCIIRDVSRIFAVSDIHGEYELFIDILQKGGVIDNQKRWIWNDGHLVIPGDIFDRGDMVTECLWLIYRLETEAKENGGAVHYLLGNHEMMVLRGDNRYVNEKYLKGIVKKSKIRHEDLYGPDMELGRWLRSKNSMVVINDIVFVHGGISSYLIEKNLSLESINNAMRNAIDLSSARMAFDDLSKFLTGSKGPLWYRGYHYEMEKKYPMISSDELGNVLGRFHADAVVVGHTEADSLISRFDNRLYCIDVPVEALGSFEGLLWEDGRFYRIDHRGSKIPF